jgi:hypothetical protein
LDDLSTYVAVREDDIVHVEDAPTDELPHGGSYIWIKSNAHVERCTTARISTEARFLAGSVAKQMTGGPAAGIRALGLKPIVPTTGGGSACEYTKVWPCSVVVGVCLASNDMPCAHTEQWWCPGPVATANTCLTCAGYTCVAECHSAGCPPTDLCTRGRVTLCGCEIYSARCR